MFGRRPKPKLSLSTRFVSPSKIKTKRCLTVILGIENIGRGTAKFPFLAVKVYLPYVVENDYGIDGRGNFGLRRLPDSSGLELEKRYGASSEPVIHPGVIHDVTSVRVEIDIEKQKEAEVHDLVIDYRIIADGVNPAEGQKTISGAELFKACRAV